MKTEGDIPGLFRQFSGNAANYQELTRAAAARASQARWPLLSAVELEQGHIPAVGGPAPDILGSATPITALLPAETDRDEQSTRGLTRLAGLAAREQSPHVDADDAPAMPAPVVRPGNTIFVPPAAHTARHFAQVERALAERAPAEPADATHEPMDVHAPLWMDELPKDLSQISAVRAAEPTPPDAAPQAARHAGLRPLFDRLAGNDPDKASVESLFTRLMRS
jgi:hypothetical protein